MNGSTVTATSAYPSHGYAAVQSTPQATAAAALSQEDATPSGKKRKASGAPGSRGVANLTPEQLAKKRANDREAQRAIRERTRNNIATLEQRIRELESQQPFQELQRVIAERDNALHECEQLRQRLATVAQVVGTAAAAAGTTDGGGQLGGAGSQQLAPGSLNELAALTAQQAPLPPHPSSAQQQQNPFPSHGGQVGFSGEQHVHPDLRSPSYGTTHGSPGSASSHQDGSALRRWSPSLTAAQYPVPQHPNGVSYEQQQPPPAQMHQQQPAGERERLGLNYIMDRGSPNQQSAQRQASSSPPLYTRLPDNSPPTCPLDSLLSDFILARRLQLANGASMAEVLGPEYPSFVVLKDSGNPAARQNCHAVSALLIDILSKFPDIDALPERVAVLYIMFLIMRWLICPCETCYERLPAWVRLVAEQLERPHAHWVDHLPWPYMRKQLSTTASVKFDEFFVPFTTTLSLNWPYPTDQVLIPGTPNLTAGSQNGSAGDLKLNPVFETHLREIKNWSLGTDFAKTFPDLVDDVRIEDDGRAVVAEH